MYINNLAETEAEQSLNSQILEILLQNKSFKEFYEKKLVSIKENTATVSHDVITLFKLMDELVEEKDGSKKLGDKRAIINEIAKINSQIDDLRIISGFSKEENVIYEKLSKHKELIKKESFRIQALNNNLEDLKNYLLNLEDNFPLNIVPRFEEYRQKFHNDPEAINVFNNIENNILSSLKKLFYESMRNSDDIINKYQKKLADLTNEIEKVENELKPYMIKIENQHLLHELQTRSEEHQSLLNKIEDHEKVIKIIENNINKTREKIFKQYSEIYEYYKDIKKELSKDEIKNIEDIELKVKLLFDNKKFSSQFEEMLDKRQDLNSLSFFNKNKQFIFEEIQHLKNIGTLFEILLTNKNENVKLRANKSQRDAISKLLDNYFVIRFDLFQKNDSIMDMSPGKRGLVLLKLFLYFSNANDPILIDQPEDNLDNRTIYKELKDFIKGKKIKRQIIMVSHNANLIVSTDSEEIIVANQDGQQPGRDNRKYKFEFVSGSLECYFEEMEKKGILYKIGIRDHVCEILEGGKDAFENREKKYGFSD